MSYRIITAQEAATYINDGDGVGISGFTLSGTPKTVLPEVAKRAEEAHAAGKPFKIDLYSGASTGDSIDGVLSRAQAIRFRAPFISNPTVRTAINNKEMAYCDLHLSLMAQDLRYGYMGKVNVAILEAIDITDDGKVYLQFTNNDTNKARAFGALVCLEVGGCTGAGDTPWPMFGQNRRHTNCEK